MTQKSVIHFLSYRKIQDAGWAQFSNRPTGTKETALLKNWEKNYSRLPENPASHIRECFTVLKLGKNIRLPGQEFWKSPHRRKSCECFSENLAKSWRRPNQNRSSHSQECYTLKKLRKNIRCWAQKFWKSADRPSSYGLFCVFTILVFWKFPPNRLKVA
jgi:hypothetical protein